MDDLLSIEGYGEEYTYWPGLGFEGVAGQVEDALVLVARSGLKKIECVQDLVQRAHPESILNLLSTYERMGFCDESLWGLIGTDIGEGRESI